MGLPCSLIHSVMSFHKHWGGRCQASRQGSGEGCGCSRGRDQGGGGKSGGAAVGAVGGEEACSEEVAEGARRRGCLWPACRVWSVDAWLPSQM